MWLIKAETLEQMQVAQIAGVDLSEISARYSAESSSGMPRGMTVAGDRAEISVTGVLTSRFDPIAYLFGGGNTVYSDVIAALATASADPKIKQIDLKIDSPGGSISGLFDAVAALQGVKKRTVARVSNQAASAAYILASAAGEIVAENPTASFGSLGIVTSAYLDDNSVDITNSESPDKRPDLSTEEGKGVVVEHLNALYDIFVEAVAQGRGVSKDKVVSDFGRGKMFVAETALQAGMIDRVERPKVPSSKTAASSGVKMEGPMDLTKLKAEFPALYAEAVGEGVKQERERVCAHLTLGEASGDMKTTIEAINSGDGLSASIQAKHMAAGMRRQDVEARATESAAAAAAAAAAAQGGEPAADDFGDKVLAAMNASKIPVFGGDK